MILNQLKEKADFIRDEVIRVACKNKCGHIAPSLSTVDILVALYYEIIFPFAHTPLPASRWEERDRLVLSKGHGCYALYAILADLGIIPKMVWENFGTDISFPSLNPKDILRGCVEYHPEWGLEAGTGSLGHGLPMAVGMAYAAKLQKLSWHTYCIVGDGELQEGSCWESIQFIHEQDLKNISVVVDKNGYMALDRTRNYINGLSFLRHNLWECDGHDIQLLASMLRQKPQFLVARTIKGKGLKCAEGVAKFHYRVPSCDEMCEGRTYGQE